MDDSRIRQRLAARALYGIKVRDGWRLPVFQFDGAAVVPGLSTVFSRFDMELHPSPLLASSRRRRRSWSWRIRCSVSGTGCVAATIRVSSPILLRALTVMPRFWNCRSLQVSPRCTYAFALGCRRRSRGTVVRIDDYRGIGSRARRGNNDCDDCSATISVREYARMLETGILGEDDRVELIDGEVREMSPIGPLHIAIVNRLNAFLSVLVDDDAIVSVQNPIQLDDYTEPQPDIALLVPRDDYYSTALAQPTDVVLLIEVADSSLEYDRDEKLPRYAASGIRELWIIDVAGRSIEQYSQPRDGQYRTKQTYEYDGHIGSIELPNIALDVSRIFG